MVVGFERPRYIVSEPESGTTTIEVCMVLTVGDLGQRIIIQPEWAPDTAQGNNKIMSLYSSYCTVDVKRHLLF